MSRILRPAEKRSKPQRFISDVKRAKYELMKPQQPSTNNGNAITQRRNKTEKDLNLKKLEDVEKKGGRNVGEKVKQNVEKKGGENVRKEVENLQVDVASLTLTHSKDFTMQLNNDVHVLPTVLAASKTPITVNLFDKESNQPAPNENRNPVFKTLSDMSNNLPCTKIDELDALLTQMGCESTVKVFVAYLKSFFGSDAKSSIKRMLDMVMDKKVQKQLSWSGRRTNKPSFEMQYKPIVNAMHFALQSHFADYNYPIFATKVQVLLQGAK